MPRQIGGPELEIKRFRVKLTIEDVVDASSEDDARQTFYDMVTDNQYADLREQIKVKEVK